MLCPDLPAVVDGVIESTDRVLFDEVGDGIGFGLGGDADEANGVTVLFLRRRDRAGFTLATWSPRGPEPENGIGALDGAEIDFAAADGGDDRSRRFRGRRLVGRLGGIGGGR